MSRNFSEQLESRLLMHAIATLGSHGVFLVSGSDAADFIDVALSSKKNVNWDQILQ